MNRLAVAACALILAGCGEDAAEQPAATTTAPATATPNETPGPSATPTPTAAQTPARRTVATGLEVPWGIAFLPNGDALVAERSTARILRIPSGGGDPERVMTVPGVARDAGEGGLLGLAVSPSYGDDGLVYAYFTSTSGDNRIVRFKLGERVRVVLKGLRSASIHNGGRIAFGPDGKLYTGVGDAGDTSLAQNAKSRNGKILRMNPDGSGARVWSLGHRNVQGLAWDRSGRLWASEFGQNTRDEVNLIRKGRNYGWPEVEGNGSTGGGKFTNPKVTWSTSQASPSGAAIIGRNLYVAALQGECVWKIPLDGASAGKPTKMLSGRYGRLRTVVAAPDGTLWVATSNTDGRGSPRSGDDRIVAVKV
ncbi:PQQ-dependent sugar dehydrogenase [Solirubrobacter phytolaccae]|uniref:PQQ-dependent sugar dehydrogenase n=1 Tax=Solirubrobacter phytolaccae TaxID=1404360 RepID=A0A9X3NHG1_9ACTN|nr:PQQ-dependent sugar dehydrogenase [Solirubrobacter phytolaccae]MDA0185409.1 PQQ-dependent sugar dehydrogenase [Solirubrobacter phytolaccae]